MHPHRYFDHLFRIPEVLRRLRDHNLNLSLIEAQENSAAPLRLRTRRLGSMTQQTLPNPVSIYIWLDHLWRV